MPFLFRDVILRLFVAIGIIFFSGACSLIQPTRSNSPVEAGVDQSPKEEPATRPLPERQPESPTVAPAKPLSPLPPPAPPEKPKVVLPPVLRVAKIEWSAVNLREGPGMGYKVIGNAKKGTSLDVLEDRQQWLRVRLEDGKEAWVYKSATLAAPKSSPADARSKPKPM